MKKDFTISTKGFCDIIDITDQVEGILAESHQIKEGVALVFVAGSTASVTTIETNANLEKDFKEALEIIAPQVKKYHHDEKWGDNSTRPNTGGNGFSHIRASLIGPSLTIPVSSGKLELGTWQQIVLCDFDNKKRERKVLVKIVGE